MTWTIYDAICHYPRWARSYYWRKLMSQESSYPYPDISLSKRYLSHQFANIQVPAEHVQRLNLIPLCWVPLSTVVSLLPLHCCKISSSQFSQFWKARQFCVCPALVLRPESLPSALKPSRQFSKWSRHSYLMEAKRSRHECTNFWISAANAQSRERIPQKVDTKLIRRHIIPLSPKKNI